MSDGNQTTAIAVTDEKVVAQITGWSNNLRQFYHGGSFDSWAQDAALAIVQNVKLKNLLNNDKDSTLLFRALQLNAASGLSLNPQLGLAAIVTYNSKKYGLQVNHLVMKNGLCQKALETRKVYKVESGTIYERDEFKVRKTNHGDEYEWLPALRDRGKPVAYFACIVLTGGIASVEYWTYEQVWEHALKYGNGRVYDEAGRKYLDEFYPDSAWGKSFNGQAEKTCIRAALNNLHLPELDEIFAKEDAVIEQMRDVTEPLPPKGTGADDLANDLANRANDTEPDEPPAEPSPVIAPNGETPLF